VSLTTKTGFKLFLRHLVALDVLPHEVGDHPLLHAHLVPVGAQVVLVAMPLDNFSLSMSSGKIS
jgi:hypothetical protein